MHQCLRIQEVLTNIFDYVFLCDEGHKSLATLARTCKTFSNPALDLLWSSQTSVLPLLKCFPKNIIKVLDSKFHSLFAFKRIPEAKDFERVHFYASRIRSLNQERCSSEYFADIVACSLLLNERLNTGAPFLPNLKHLTLGLDDFHGQAVYPRLVMAPNLRSIVLIGGSEYYDMDESQLEDVWKNVLALLGPCLPLLRKFETEERYELYGREYHNLPTTKSLCSSFQEIQNLTIPLLNLSVETLAHLAKMHALTKFEFTMTSETLLLFNPSPGDFSCIQDLAIHTNGIDGCAHFLSCQPFTHLHNLTVIDDGLQLNWSFDSLVEHMKTPSLRCLKLLKPSCDWLEPEDEAPVQVVPFRKSTLNFLLQIKSLVT